MINVLIQVFNLDDKNKLIELGYKFITEQKLGEITAYVFENNNKLKFSDLGVKAKFTNKMYF